MPIWDGLGRRVLEMRPPGCALARVSQWLPARERWYVLRGVRRDYHVLWRPFRGLSAIGSGDVGSVHCTNLYPDPRKVERMFAKRQMADGAPVIRPALPAESKVLGKLPTLVAFLRDTVYEDGSPRQPGYIWFTNRWSSYEVILFDPDSCSKLAVNGPTIDDTLALAEASLRAPDAPWQLDQYMVERKVKGRKK